MSSTRTFNVLPPKKSVEREEARSVAGTGDKSFPEFDSGGACPGTRVKNNAPKVLENQGASSDLLP